MPPKYDESQDRPMAPRDNEGKRLNEDSSVDDFQSIEQRSPTPGGMVNTMRGVDTPARTPKGD